MQVAPDYVQDVIHHVRQPHRLADFVGGAPYPE
jgi:hypothetical protein